jgi:hypothetical protein
MATGENSGTWGIKTNNNLYPLIEEAISMQADVAMLDATTTLTLLNGVSCEARCFVLDVTGVISGARDLVVPTIQKPYVVANNTTGGHSIVVRTAFGTGITVTNGSRRFVYVDGVNVVEMVNSAGSGSFTSLSVSGNATIGGTLGVTGAVTMASTLGVTGAITGASFNKVAITAPATSATLTIADGKTVTINNGITLAGTDGTVLTFPNSSGTVVTTGATQTLNQKTLNSPTISTIENGGTLTLPTGTDTIVGRATTDTLTNKTLTSPVINTGNLGGASIATTQSAGDNSTKLATTAYVDVTRVAGARVTNSLGADVNMPVLATYYTGPSVAQGSTGTWYATGTITVSNASAGDVIDVKLWDGTTVISSARVTMTSVGVAFYEAVSLSGYITSPAGNIRMSAAPVTRTDNFIAYDVSGNGKDSTLSAIRIA